MPVRSSVRFTDAYIKSLKPTASRYDLYDANLAGFGIRVSPSGAKSWMALSRNLGRKTRVTLGRYPQMSLGIARQRAMNTLWKWLMANSNGQPNFNFLSMLWRTGTKRIKLKIKAFYKLEMQWNFMSGHA